MKTLSLAKQLSKAIAIAGEAHDKQLDRGGNPYILHPMRVMMKFQGDTKAMIVAILHDVVEDCEDWTFDRLKESGITDKEVIDSLMAITKTDDIGYYDYILTISLYEIASRVKQEDIVDNSQLTRLKGIRPKDFVRGAKYNAAFMFLQGKIDADAFKKVLDEYGVK